MLTLRYQAHQPGPLYTFQIESQSHTPLTKDLFAIAYRSDDVPRDTASGEEIATMARRFLMGRMTCDRNDMNDMNMSTYVDDALNVVSLSFEDNEVRYSVIASFDLTDLSPHSLLSLALSLSTLSTLALHSHSHHSHSHPPPRAS
jgi:hypothetical protein